MRELTSEVADKVLLDEETNTRTFDKVGVEVAFLDGVLEDAAFNSPVPVFSAGSGWSIIGSAALYRQGKSLLADIFLRYDSPERLSLENGEALYPSVGFSFRHVVLIGSITLGIHPGCDHRIGPV